MSIYSKLIYLFRNSASACLNAIKVTRIRYTKNNEQERLKSESQRIVHQIEKGLSVDNPRKGFGYDKIRKLIKYLTKLTEKSKEADEIRNRIGSCIESYFIFYEENDWDSLEIHQLKEYFLTVKDKYTYDPSFGGLLIIDKVIHNEREYMVLDDIASSRHSIRDFKDDEIDIKVIKKAIEFAQKAPSACNRQAVRCYIIDKTKFSKYGNWLKNIGFFGEYGFDKLLLITGKITGYNENEGLQHLVSPGIFVGYLILVLEALNIGACVMQRSIYYDKGWKNARKMMNIPEDEQSFCLIGLGVKKDKYKVPVSRRLSTDIIMKEL